MLNWWLSHGGVPENVFQHERCEEEPLKVIPGLMEKFQSILRRSDGQSELFSRQPFIINFVGNQNHIPLRFQSD